MIKVINCKKKNYKRELVSFLDKRRSGKAVDTSIVPKILKDIKINGRKALLKYEKKFSKNIEIVPSKDKVNKAINTLEPKIKKSIDLAYNRIFKFHSLQKPKNIKYVDNFKNKLEYKHVPLQSVGIYVPANLPSTLLMNAVPAKISGVKRIVLANPKLNGKLNPAVLYAAKKVGINEIYSMGGAQAIASLAYIQKVNKIVGPGNIYVARSKREVFGDVGTEGMVAGPSEICVLADGKTDLNQVITSMIGQAEHDVNSQCILITKDKNLIKKFKKDLVIKLKKIPRQKIATKSIKNNGLILKVNSDKQIINIINQIAPEHLELCIENPKLYLDDINNAGSIFLGSYTPEAIGDYIAGPNHVLPTEGTARFSSGLGTNDYLRRTTFVQCNEYNLNELGKHAEILANAEGLDAHRMSINSRKKCD